MPTGVAQSFGDLRCVRRTGGIDGVGMLEGEARVRVPRRFPTRAFRGASHVAMLAQQPRILRTEAAYPTRSRR
jgi:hypothetical protein